ncbi:hypothetical protein ASPVEDRAFT_51079 [Aspergillus versicolor CBS 583.65]|uniref:Mitochondrial thiamine pyrophosphate carrier 1 n=1 Tax=Aspergillus versicolor CBS 583.65 TaxID=1036611 RepID=A0A1L9PE67_ASPVE|nr:uncharacterized protein ASPVEDRAFT_51079 [Aspergillus versicolor CBS 583.65]OJI99744.1 hypothetical protein ASPVEDRAFT_51079 [Aspergillus versicolor CBS 583.65]
MSLELEDTPSNTPVHWKETAKGLAAGAAGGAAQVLIGTLVPLLGVSIQFGAFHSFRQLIQHYNQTHKPTGRLYSGPWDCVRKIVRTAGLSGLYRGQVVTLLREFHCYGVWFAAYEGLLGVLQEREQRTYAQLSSWQFVVCGGLAGETLWLLSQPLDVIKSKMQSDGFGPEYTFQATSEDAGVRDLFQALGSALLRAMPVSAGTFATVEVVRKFLS